MKALSLAIVLLTVAAACGETDTPANGDGVEPTGAATAHAVGTKTDEELYRKRFAALRDRTGATGLASYDPLKAVAGAADSVPFVVDDGGSAFDDEALAEAASYAESMNSSAFLVWHDGALVAERYFGEATKESPLVSKSLAKPLSVIAVGRAIVEGHIASLDDPVAVFVEEWRGTPKAAMTIRHLLGMRSGLLPQGAAESVDDVLNRAYLHPRHDEVIVHEYPLTHQPGSRYEYSNANGELVAVLIERATNVQYEDWVDAEVLRTIGAPGGDVWMNRPGGTAHSGCCWLLPAKSWLRLGILLLNDGKWGERRLLPSGFVDDMRRTTKDNPHAGLGVYIAGAYVERRGPLHPSMEIGRTYHSEPYLADDLFLFDGNSNQVVYIVPSAGLVVARLGGRPPAETPWDNALLPNTLIRGLAPELAETLRPQPNTKD